MSALTASAPTLAALSGARRAPKQHRRRAAPVFAVANQRVVVKTDANNTQTMQKVALGLGAAATTLVTAAPAHAMDGAMSVFNGNPGAVGPGALLITIQYLSSLQHYQMLKTTS
jgi:hypothetical protein